MKKTLGLVGASALVFLMAGCGKADTLTCTYGDSASIIGTKMGVELTYDGNSIKSGKGIIEFEDKSLAKSTYEMMKGDSTLEVKLDGKKITSKLTADELEEYNDYKTKAELKKAMEENGFTCK